MSNSITDKLIKSSTTPGELICKAMDHRKIDVNEFANRLGSTMQYVLILRRNERIPAKRACLSIAKALDLDPVALNRFCSDYGMRQLIKEEERKARRNEKRWGN